MAVGDVRGWALVKEGSYSDSQQGSNEIKETQVTGVALSVLSTQQQNDKMVSFAFSKISSTNEPESVKDNAKKVQDLINGLVTNKAVLLCSLPERTLGLECFLCELSNSIPQPLYRLIELSEKEYSNKLGMFNLDRNGNSLQSDRCYFIQKVQIKDSMAQTYQYTINMIYQSKEFSWKVKTSLESAECSIILKNHGSYRSWLRVDFSPTSIVLSLEDPEGFGNVESFSSIVGDELYSKKNCSVTKKKKRLEVAAFPQLSESAKKRCENLVIKTSPKKRCSPGKLTGGLWVGFEQGSSKSLTGQGIWIEFGNPEYRNVQFGNWTEGQINQNFVYGTGKPSLKIACFPDWTLTKPGSELKCNVELFLSQKEMKASTHTKEPLVVDILAIKKQEDLEQFFIRNLTCGQVSSSEMAERTPIKIFLNAKETEDWFWYGKDAQALLVTDLDTFLKKPLM